MKLILKEYLASLRERDELDAILPDLLSQLGLNVFSSPARGTRQAGVDVGGVGCLEGGTEKVYLLSIKAGNLTRQDWDGNPQALRPSLNEILDSYIPNRLPPEHRGKDVVICIVLGGDVQEQVRSSLSDYTAKYTTTNVTFEEWNGDRLAAMIERYFLREDLLPKDAQGRLRKSVALIDEPEASQRHFAALVGSLSSSGGTNNERRVTAVRQIAICLWILFSWARGAGNLESAYLSGELALLHGWKVVGEDVGKEGKTAEALQASFVSIFRAYQQICAEFLEANVLPHVVKRHAVSAAVWGSSSVDVNLKLFDLLGRLAVDGIWAYWILCRLPEGQERQRATLKVGACIASIKLLISNNPVLFLPLKDDQAIEISLAALLLAVDKANHSDIRGWLSQILERATFAYDLDGPYPCILRSYADLLSHPKAGDKEYKENVTGGSILYPVISLWAALLGDDETYGKVARFKTERLQHCNFQVWYPDGESEKHIYDATDLHGGVVSEVWVDHPKAEFLEQVFGECRQSPYFKELSAVKFAWWPLIAVACRHHRLPVPLHLIEMIYDEKGSRLAASDPKDAPPEGQ